MADSPLSQRDYVDINKALRKLSEAEEEIKRAARAGIDCEEEDIRCQHVKQMLSLRKQAYFPNQA